MKTPDDTTLLSYADSATCTQGTDIAVYAVNNNTPSPRVDSQT
jgi:hypothetical protein